MRQTKLVGIDLFSGAGGLSLGAEMAGIDVRYAVEINKDAAETYFLNHPNTTVYNKDIHFVCKSDFEVENSKCIVFGGAPCQGFSSSNRRTSSKDNPQNWLYLEFIRIVNEIKPEWFVFENVTGLVELESGLFFYDIITKFEGCGYTCSHAIIDASELGVPQKRKRLFVVGSKSGAKISLEHYQKHKKVSVQEAFYDLPVLRNGASIDVLPYRCEANSKFAKEMRSGMSTCSGHLVSKNKDNTISKYKFIKQGENWKAIPKEMMANYSNVANCHTGIYYRLLENEPSVVIGNYRKNMLIHPNYDRGLSVREAARLQSFPDSYVFSGNLGSQQQQVGNAVPPLLAKYVFDTIIHTIEEQR